MKTFMKIFMKNIRNKKGTKLKWEWWNGEITVFYTVGAKEYIRSFFNHVWRNIIIPRTFIRFQTFWGLFYFIIIKI